MLRSLIAPTALSPAGSFALLTLRLVSGVALMNPGWGKIQNPFHWMDKGDAPAAPLLQAAAALSEFGGGLAFILGLLTPLAALGVVSTMAVAISTHLGRGDAFVGKGGSWELAGVYGAIGLVLLFVGPGALSVDRFLRGWLSTRASSPPPDHNVGM